MRVLFVEDDPMNRRVVRDMLSVADVDMAEADNGPAGLALLNDEDFDLILMDLRMPGMEGLTAIGHIRARLDAKADLPIIVVTADSGVDLRDRCIAGGADGVIQKPVAMNALFDEVGRLLATGPRARAVA